MKRRREALLAQRLWALFAAGWLLFSFPLLRLWLADGATLWLGLPRLPLALFAGWAVLVALLALLLETQQP